MLTLPLVFNVALDASLVACDDDSSADDIMKKSQQYAASGTLKAARLQVNRVHLKISSSSVE